jgi:hypothetical protein
MMKKLSIAIILFIAFTVSLNAQFKSDLDKNDNIFESVPKSNPNLILGLFNPDNFSMKHSYQLVYSSFGANSIGLGIYTNSMKYKFTDNLNARVDLSLVHSPFGSYSKNFSDQLTGFYVNRAEINYKPFNNCVIQLRYQKLPNYGYYGTNGYYPYSNMGYDPIFGYDSFSDDEFHRR